MKIGWRTGGKRRSLVRLVLIGVAITLGVVGYLLGPPFLELFSHPYLVGQVTAAFLRGMLGLYLTGLVVSLTGSLFLTRSILRARQRREKATKQAKWLAACVSYLIGALLMEGCAAIWLARAHRIATPEPQYTARPLPKDPAPSDLYIVVFGESTALGSPFDPNLSIGQMVGWKLESVFPARRVVVEIRAVGGFNLEKSLRSLAYLPRRPDAILLYCGHNEFQSFYKLSRSAKYYLDEVSFLPEQPVNSFVSRHSPRSLLRRWRCTN